MLILIFLLELSLLLNVIIFIFLWPFYYFFIFKLLIKYNILTYNFKHSNQVIELEVCYIEYNE